jgi:hypothetical protein
MSSLVIWSGLVKPVSKKATVLHDHLQATVIVYTSNLSLCLHLPEEVILSEERTTEEEKLKIMEGTLDR